MISADTVVVIDKQIIGKPKDSNDAYCILRKLSGKHYVYTAYTIKRGHKVMQNIVKTVYYKLSDEFILAYIASGSPMDKAGAWFPRLS